MRQIATLDWTCAHCGATETWQLVMVDHRDPAEGEEPAVADHPLPTLDWSCAKCGSTETWQLVKA
jgi:ribosomal protein S27AE